MAVLQHKLGSKEQLQYRTKKFLKHMCMSYNTKLKKTE